MPKQKQDIIKQRIAKKKASRACDVERLAAGEDPEVLQRKNSIFSKEFFKGARISNLAQIAGRHV